MDKLNTLREYMKFLSTRKRYWLTPIAFMTLLIGLALTFAQGSIMAPLLYPIF